MNHRHIIASIVVALLVFGCDKQVRQPGMLEREKLFSLDIGRLENQIALYNIDRSQGRQLVNIAIRDGLFYVSDTNGAKVLRFNSFGDILYMIYNNETNPEPVTLLPLVEGNIVTRGAVQYPLLEPGKITVDSRRHLFVQDRLPADRHSVDTESKSILDNVVLHFDADGRFVKYLGREGIGGSPFPRIEGLYTTSSDDLVVVSRLPSGWNIYWFDSDGFYLFVVHLRNDAVPLPSGYETLIPSLDGVFAGPRNNSLYFKVDYYQNITDESGSTRTGIEVVRSLLWIMSAEDGVLERYVELPLFDRNPGTLREGASQRPYSLLGITGSESEWAILYFPSDTDGGYVLNAVPLDPAARRQRHGFIELPAHDIQFSVFNLSADTILAGLLAKEWHVELVWWRIDHFLEAEAHGGN